METKIDGQIKNNNIIEVNQITSIIICTHMYLKGEKRPQCMLSCKKSFKYKKTQIGQKREVGNR